MNVSGRANRNAQTSGRRTARVFGSTSPPTRDSTSNPGTENIQGQSPRNPIQKQTASIAASAKEFPRAIVAISTCGFASSEATMPPLTGFLSARSLTCQAPNENRAVSARAKKKLAPVKTRTPAAARMLADPMSPEYITPAPQARLPATHPIPPAATICAICGNPPERHGVSSHLFRPALPGSTVTGLIPRGKPVNAPPNSPPPSAPPHTPFAFIGVHSRFSPPWRLCVSQ